VVPGEINMGWIIAIWLFLGIVGATIGLAYDLARGYKIVIGNAAVAFGGPIVLLAALATVVEHACTPQKDPHA
jgi:hypothetical protein